MHKDGDSSHSCPRWRPFLLEINSMESTRTNAFSCSTDDLFFSPSREVCLCSSNIEWTRYWQDSSIVVWFWFRVQMNVHRYRWHFRGYTFDVRLVSAQWEKTIWAKCITPETLDWRPVRITITTTEESIIKQRSRKRKRMLSNMFFAVRKTT